MSIHIRPVVVQRLQITVAEFKLTGLEPNGKLRPLHRRSVFESKFESKINYIMDFVHQLLESDSSRRDDIN